MKISRFFFGGSKFSSYLCHRLQDDSKLSGKATVIAYGFSAAGFFYAYKVSFSRQREKGLFNMAAA